MWPFNVKPTPSDAALILSERSHGGRWKTKAVARKLREELGLPPARALR